MAIEPGKLKLAVVAGEESGEILAEDIIQAIATKTKKKPELVGIGGQRLAGLGLHSYFNSEDIALMGLSAIVADLPRLVYRINLVAREIARAKPDAVILVDSPAFNLRVAKKLRRLNADIPIVQYVCPSVWAWGPQRAPAMKASCDHVLCILPFEPEILKNLNGPPGTFVGHRLLHDPGVKRALELQGKREATRQTDEKANILILPGSRASEVKRLLPVFGQAIEIFRQRNKNFRLFLPAVDRVRDLVESEISGWDAKPELVSGSEKWDRFGAADAALCASGTVSLELALSRVPHVVAYKVDMLVRTFSFLVTTWSAALPNLVAGYPFVPEYFNEFVRPALLARHLERLFRPTAQRQSQLSGFSDVRRNLEVEQAAGETGANIVLDLIESGRNGIHRLERGT